MSRRIIVIDADVGFQRLLRDELGPYGFDIVVAMDAADAIAKVPQLNPTLLVIAVEEPDKQGFATFNKAKKGVAANVPIVLATATVAPDSFINHRRLKLHADEYIDKRQLSANELLGKIDNLIGLGDMIIPSREIAIASDPSLQIPVEVDDVPMELSDGDLVLEETFGEDEPVLHQTTPPPMSGGIEIVPALGDNGARGDANRTLMGEPIDDGLSAETDAAFDALVGGEDSAVGAPPTPTAPPSTPRPRSLSAVPEEVPAPDPPRLPILIEPESSRGPERLEELVGGGAIPQPIGEPAAPFAPPPESSAPAPFPAAVSRGSAIDLGLDEVAARADEEQTSGMHDRRTLQKVHTLERENARLKAELDKARDGVGSGKATGASREFLNLREMISARDKEILELREAAADHDRVITEARERLRQLGHAKQVLDAKNSQLEARLLGDTDRAETAVASLKSAEARAAEAQARLADVEHAARNEIERMAAAVTRAEKSRMEAEAAMMLERGGRDSAIEQEKVRALAALRAELEANHQTVLAMRDQELEEQVTALRAVHGEELTEHKDGATRELAQVADRHGRDVGQLQQEHARELAAVREAHGREIADAQQAYARLQDTHGDDLAAVQQSLIDERTAALQELARTRDAMSAADQAAAAMLRDHTEALASAGDRHQRELEAVRQTHAVELAAREQQRTDEVEAARQAAAQEVAAASYAAKRELAAAQDVARRELVATRDEFGTALAAAEQARSDDVGAAHEAHRAEQEQLTQSHAAELGAARADAERAVADAGARHAAVLDAERGAAARTLAETETRLGTEIANLRAAVEEADAQLRAERRTLAETMREVEAREAAALADAAAQRDAAVTEAARVHAGELEQARAGFARDMIEQQGRHTAALDELRAQHVRGLADKDATAAAAAEEQRQALQLATTAAAEHLGRVRGDHARQLDQAEIRLKTQRESDRADGDRAIAAARADHESQLAEAHEEISQLEKGLSGQRDAARKLEEQIVGLNRTIKQRDDEIRSHAAAVTERDRRITELRGEIESLEAENASYQEQVLKAYQKIKSDEATVSRAKKALAIALTALDEEKKKDAGS